MSFREKISWLTLIAIALVFIPYFASVLLYDGQRNTLPMFSLGALVMAVVALTVVMSVVGIVTAIRNPDEANAPADERDRSVSRRASSIAYAVLLPAVLIAAGSAHLHWGTTFLLNAILGAVVLAEIVRCSLEVIGYRRGW